MNQLKLYEIYDERHIIASDGTIYFYEISDDLSLKCLEKKECYSIVIQILKHSKNIFLFKH